MANPSRGLSGGAIAGIVVGAILGAILVAGLVFFCMRRQKKTYADVPQTDVVVPKTAEAPYYGRHELAAMYVQQGGQHELATVPPRPYELATQPTENEGRHEVAVR